MIHENFKQINIPQHKWQGPSVDFSHGDLKVTDCGRYIQHTDGTPFFYLGDTAWQLFHLLTKEEIDYFMENRRGKGFTVIQAVALSEFDGLNTTNAYGEKPLIDNDPTKPNDAYFQHIDYAVEKALEKGLYIGLLPTWGDKVDLWKWGIGPVVFNPQNARIYGKYIGSRYKDYPNIIWIIGGDRSPEGYEEVWREMARGIEEGDGGRHLKTYHPLGWQSSSQFFHSDDWLDFNMLQSGHSMLNFDNYRLIEEDYLKEPPKPCIDGEPCYEGHPINWEPQNGYFDGFDARQAAYWAVFAGAFGHTYGCHDVWQMYSPQREPITFARTFWKNALNLPGAWGMLCLRNLIESRPYFTRIPNQSLILSDPLDGAEHLRATSSSDGSYAFIYIPTGKPVEIDMSKISGDMARAWWFDPRLGDAELIGLFSTTEPCKFVPPSSGRGHDWVLVLDDASKNYFIPGR